MQIPREGDLPAVVVLRALGLGDLLTGIPALRALADAFPEHRRVLAMPAALTPVLDLAGCGFEVRDTPAQVATIHDFRLPGAPLAARVDAAVNLHGRGPQSHRAVLALAEALTETGPGSRPPRLVAFDHPQIAESAGLPPWRADEHEVHRWCRLLSESGIPADPARISLRAPEPAGCIGEAPAVIHPGAASAARRWPARRWAEVAGELHRRGVPVAVTGSRAEIALAQQVVHLAGLPASSVLAGRTTLRQLASAVAGARLVASGDTGIAHLATALGTPSVVLFGPTPPQWWGPPPGHTIHRVLWKGRVGDPHGRRPDPGLLAIQPSEVLGAIEALEQARFIPRESGKHHRGSPHGRLPL